jgi:hypothetical protein
MKGDAILVQYRVKPFLYLTKWMQKYINIYNAKCVVKFFVIKYMFYSTPI